MATEKERFASEVVQFVQLLAKAADIAPRLALTWTKNGYNAAGADPIIDADLSAQFNFSATDLLRVWQLINEFDQFLIQGDGTQAITSGRFSAVVKLIYGAK